VCEAAIVCVRCEHVIVCRGLRGCHQFKKSLTS
jgi:hypothetical protein